MGRMRKFQPDMARLAAALSIPGIDPRIWVSYAYLASDPKISLVDGQQDITADIVLMPSGQPETARVGAAYAGNGFGFYCPLHQYDEVLVLAPSGDPDEGLVIAQRLWSPADVPPSEVSDNPEDVTLVVEPDKNLRLTVKGGGNVILAVDTGKIYLGSEEETEPAAKGQSLKSYLESIKSTFDGHAHQVTAVGTPSLGPMLAASPSPLPVTFAVPTDALLSTTTEVK